MNKELLEQLAKSDFGKGLIDYLDEEISGMENIMDIKGTTEEKGRITEARQEAVKILKKLFSFLYTVRENKPKIKRTNYL